MAGEWREVRLGELADIVMGQSPPGSSYNDRGEGLPFFQGVADFGYRHPMPRVYCTAPSRIAQPGDILLSVRAPIGRVNVADRECAIGRGLSIVRPRNRRDGRYIEFALRYMQFYWEAIEGGGSMFELRKGKILFGKLRPYFHKVGVAPVAGVCSTDIVVVAPKLPHWFGFVSGIVSSQDFVEYTNAGSTGTKMPGTSWVGMARYSLVLLREFVASAFDHVIEPLVARTVAGIHESRTLAVLRDRLLPKLIRGEIRVRDVDRFLQSPLIGGQKL